MSLPVITRDEAEADIVEAAIWYERRCAGLGAEFVRSVDVLRSHFTAARGLSDRLPASEDGTSAKVPLPGDLSSFSRLHLCGGRDAWPTSSPPLEIENYRLNHAFDQSPDAHKLFFELVRLSLLIRLRDRVRTGASTRSWSPLLSRCSGLRRSHLRSHS